MQVQFIRESTWKQIVNQVCVFDMMFWYWLSWIIENKKSRSKYNAKRHKNLASFLWVIGPVQVKYINKGKMRPMEVLFFSIIIQTLWICPSVSLSVHQPQIHLLLFHENLFHILILWLECQWKHSPALPQQSTLLTFIDAERAKWRDNSFICDWDLSGQWNQGCAFAYQIYSWHHPRYDFTLRYYMSVNAHVPLGSLMSALQNIHHM